MRAQFRPALLTVFVCGSEVFMHRLTALAMSVPILLGSQRPAPAQSPGANPSESLYVVRIPVKPGGVPAYESFTKKIVAGAEKIGAAQHWMAWMVNIGGPRRAFHIVLPFDKWKEGDGWDFVPQILTKGDGDAEGRRNNNTGSARIKNKES